MLLSTQLAACASSGCSGDPRTDSVSCASRALSTGTYEIQTASLSQNLATTRASAAQQAEQSKNLDATLAGLQQRRAKLERELASLAAQLDGLAQRKDADLKKIAALRSAIAASQERLVASPGNPSVLAEEERGLQLYHLQLREVTRS